MKKIVSILIVLSMILSFCAFADDDLKGENLVYFASFENGFEDWTYNSENSKDYVKLLEDRGADGEKSVYLYDSTEEEGPGLKSSHFPVLEETTYTAAACTIGVFGGIKFYVRYYDKDDKMLEEKSKVLSYGSDWSEMVIVSKSPKGAVTAELVVSGLKQYLGEAYFDNIRMYKGEVDIPERVNKYIPPKQEKPLDASIVAPVFNKLIYNAYNAEGDTLGDYSYGGFYSGLYELPESKNLPVVMELSPSGTSDDTNMIQEAIDKVYNDALNDNFKIIRLKAGKYNINKNGIKLKSGIILSGEGQGPTGTILYAYEPVKNTPVVISGTPSVKVGETYNIVDDYVKSGSKKIHISEEDVKNFKAGDLITICHPSTEKWVEAVRMVNMENSSGGNNSWKAGGVNMSTERTITAINGNELTLDYAFFVPHVKEYSQSYIYKTDDYLNIKHAGVENLRIESYYNGNPEDESHGNIAINITHAKNCFVRDVSVKYFILSAVSCGAGAKQITVLNVSSLQPVSTLSGSRRYAFASSTSAQKILFAGCYSYDSRHDYEASYSVTGPIVFVDSVIDKSNSSAETHGTWSTGLLYDNIYQVPTVSGGFFCLANRGIYGTSKSQGWTAAGSVMWNTLSNLTIAHKPPMTYQNFLVGVWGVYNDKWANYMKKRNAADYKVAFRTTDYYKAEDFHYATKEGTPFTGDAYMEAEFTPVNPRSLYKAQLSERFTGVISNARPNAPVIVYPRADKEEKDGNILISGIFQMGATEVTVYIDDIPNKATIKEADNSFELKCELNEGVHKIYATQTIDGVESTKTADRFIIIGNMGTENPAYLQSIYDSSKTRMLINDTRETFDITQERLAMEDANKIIVLVNGKKLIADVEPFETNGRVLVPMRAIFEALKAEVSWDEATLTATARKEETEVKITENQTTAYVNSNPITLDVSATILNGRFVVPIRFISESFGVKTEWIEERRTVTVDSGESRGF